MDYTMFLKVRMLHNYKTWECTRPEFSSGCYGLWTTWSRPNNENMMEDYISDKRGCFMSIEEKGIGHAFSFFLLHCKLVNLIKIIQKYCCFSFSRDKNLNYIWINFLNIAKRSRRCKSKVFYDIQFFFGWHICTWVFTLWLHIDTRKT